MLCVKQSIINDFDLIWYVVYNLGILSCIHNFIDFVALRHTEVLIATPLGYKRGKWLKFWEK